MKNEHQITKPQQPKPNDPSSKPEQTHTANQSQGQSLNVTDESIELTQDAQEAINIILNNDHTSTDDSAQSPKAQRTSKLRV
ncbi:MAG: hypothetical protein ACYT04_38985 [Nostoc sp.]